MKASIKFRKILKAVFSLHSCLAIFLGGFAANAVARAVTPVPEPSMLSLVGAGVVVAVIIYRMKGGK